MDNLEIINIYLRRQFKHLEKYRKGWKGKALQKKNLSR